MVNLIRGELSSSSGELPEALPGIDKTLLRKLRSIRAHRGIHVYMKNMQTKQQEEEAFGKYIIARL